jgi:hypothetical protein
LQEEAAFVGRVNCDADDSKLTANSVVLVGSGEGDSETGLSLQKLENYSLFLGQVVALKAHHAGNKLVATEVFDNVKLQFPEKKIAFDFTQGENTVILCAESKSKSRSKINNLLLIILNS